MSFFLPPSLPTLIIILHLYHPFPLSIPNLTFRFPFCLPYSPLLHIFNLNVVPFACRQSESSDHNEMPATNTSSPPHHAPPPPPRHPPPPPPPPRRPPPPTPPSRRPPPPPPPPTAHPHTPQIRPPNAIHNSANGATGHRHRVSFHGYPMAPFHNTNTPGRQAPTTTSGTIDFIPRASTLRSGIQRYQPALRPTPRGGTMQPGTHLGRLASGPIPRAESGTHLGRLAPSSIPRTGANPRNQPRTSIVRTNTTQSLAPRISSSPAPQRVQDRRRSDLQPRGTLAPAQTIHLGAVPRAQQQQQQPRSNAPPAPLPPTGRMSPESKQLVRASVGAVNGLPKNKYIQRKNHKEVVAVNPLEIVKVTEVMPDGYWCGRFSGLSGRMAETNPGLDLKTLDRLVLDMLEKCCEGADVKKGFRAWRKEFEGRKRWEGKDD